MKNIYVELSKELQKKRTLALATIIETKGSVPQVPGASAVFSTSGLLTGTLGGGILEADSQKKALAAMEKKQSILSDFDLTSNALSEEEAICGGTVKILIDGSPEGHSKTFQSLRDSHDNQKSGILATLFNKISGDTVRISRHWIDKHKVSIPNSDIHRVLSREDVQKTLSRNRPALLTIGDTDSLRERGKDNFLFLEPVIPPSQLVIAGAGHIGQALARLGNLLNFEVTVIDDRAEYANSGKLPDTDHIIVGDTGKAIKDFPITPETFIVIVTRGHRFDAEALKNCITSSAAYIGMIGSRRKIALLRDRFLSEGWASAEEWDRVHSPIGLPINSKTVEEIAVSIAAQLVLVRSQKLGIRGEHP